MTARAACAVAIACAGLAASPAGAQDAGALYVPTDAEATREVERAVRRRRDGDWDGAVTGWQALLDARRDALVPVPGKPGRWAAAGTVAAGELLGWPAEGLDRYRARVEDEARTRLAAGADGEVVARFPASASAAVALARRADRALEDGRFAPAADLYDRLLRRATLARPDAWMADPTPILRRAALAYAGAGLPGRLEALIASPLAARGGEVLAATLVRALARAREAATPTAPPADWPTIGGDATRNRLGGPEVRLDAPLGWLAECVAPHGTLAADGWNSGSYVDLNGRRGGVSERTLLQRYRPVHPVVWRGNVYVPGGQGVEVFELYTGRLRRQDALNLSSPAAENARLDPNVLHTATAAGDALFVLTGLDAAQESVDLWQGQVRIREAIPRRRLLCLDLVTGRVRWDAGATDGLPDSPLDERSIVSPPLVADDVVYVVSRRGTGGLAELFCSALDAATGRVRWDAYIGAGGQELNMFGRPMREVAVSPLALAGGTVYCCTNLGAVVALGATDGTVRWLARYPTVELPYSANFNPVRRAPTFDTNPVVVAEDLLIVAPNDAPVCFACDRQTGERRWTYPFAGPDPDDSADLRCLLGALADRVILTGRQVVALDLATGGLRWSFPPTPREEPAGRGALTPGAIYWPTGRALFRLDPAGNVLQSQAWGNWRGVMPGNCVVVGGTLVVTWFADRTAGCAAIFRREVVLAELEARAAAYAHDPEPLLTAAEIRLQAGELPFARQALERVRARLVHAPPGPATVALATRTREATLALELRAAQLARAGSPEALEALGRARAAADTPAEQVRIRQRIADHHLAADDARAYRATLREIADRFGEVPVIQGAAGLAVPAGLDALRQLAQHLGQAPGEGAALVAVLQEILARWPRVPWPDGDAAEPAGRVVRERLHAFLRTGRAAYARFDGEARALVAQAAPAEAEAVAATLLARYPNAEVVPTAVPALAAALRKAGRPAAAAHVLRTYLEEVPGARADVPSALLLVACDEDERLWPAARATLERLARDHAGARVVPPDGGTPVVVGDLVRERLARPGYASTAAGPLEPDVAVPLAERFRVTVASDGRLLDVRGRPALAAQGLAFVASGTTLHAYDGHTGAPRWSAALAGTGALLDAVAGEALLLLAPGPRVAAVDPADGRIVWQVTVPVDTRCYLAAEDGVVLVAGARGGMGLVRALDEATGRTRWEQTVPDPVLPTPALRGETVLLHCRPRAGAGRRTVVRSCSLATGVERFLVGTDVPDAAAVPPMFAEDGTVVLAPTRSEVRAVDAVTGEDRWHHPLRGARLAGRFWIGRDRVGALLTPVGGNGVPGVLALDARTGTEAWTRPVEGLRLEFIPQAAGEDCFVLGGGDTPRIECLDISDGRTPRWASELDPALGDCTALVVGRRVVVAVQQRAERGAGTRCWTSFVPHDRVTGKLLQDPPAQVEFDVDRLPRPVALGCGTICVAGGGLLVGVTGAK